LIVSDVREEAFRSIGIGLFLGHGFVHHSQRVANVAMPPDLVEAKWCAGGPFDLMECKEGAVLVFKTR